VRVGVVEGFEAAQARAGVVEEARDCLSAARVAVLLEQFDGAAIDGEQRGEEAATRAEVRRSREERRGEVVRQIGERVQQLDARRAAVRFEARDVAAVQAAAGDFEVCARPPADSRRFEFASGRLAVGARVACRKSQPGVAFYRGAGGTGGLGRRPAVFGAAGFVRFVFEAVECVEERALGAFKGGFIRRKIFFHGGDPARPFFARSEVG